jgi:hypothetical protein
MTDASGNPSGFTLMVYSMAVTSILPGGSLGTLDGSLNPVAGGIFTYTPASNFALSPNITSLCLLPEQQLPMALITGVMWARISIIQPVNGISWGVAF